jgi:outer membrane protein OmpA-like peptidoglycan-associated protein
MGSDLTNYFERIKIRKFQFSNGAKSFWQETLGQTTLSELADYPVIKDVFQVTRLQPVAVPQTPPAVRPREGNRRRLYISTGAIALLIVVLVFGLKWRQAPPEEETTLQTNSSRTARTPETTFKAGANQLQVDDPAATPIYQTLRSTGQVSLNNLPTSTKFYQQLGTEEPANVEKFLKGRPAEEARLKAFLDDLAKVLGKTYWRVSIEIYSDLSGTEEQNNRTCQSRSDAIKAYLLKTGTVGEVQPEMVIKGKSDPVFRSEFSAEDKAANRRIVVRLKSNQK